MRPRSRSMPDLPSQQRRVNVDTRHYNVPIQERPHGFQLQVNMPGPLVRRNSFNMLITAHQGQKTLGSISMTVHRNRTPVDHQTMDQSQIGKRMHGKTTAYIGNLRNETFTGFDRGVQH